MLAPFDSLVWNRDRVLRLFGFHYRIEIYTPAPQRVHGYYVLPFLHGERLVGRVDVKAQRKESTLDVFGAFGEDGVGGDAEVGAAMAVSLRSLAAWLGLEHVRVGTRGDLAGAVAAATGTRR